MRLSTKVILWAWVGLFVILGSLVFSAYTKLNPDSLVQLLNKQVQRSYPGSNLTVAKIDYGFSLDFKLTLSTLTLTKGEKTLASANEVQLKVPWWLILINRGNAQVNINNLVVFVSSGQSTGVPQIKAPSAPAPSTKVEIDIPKYLLDAQYTLRAKNISVKELDGDRRFFTLSKLLVREFQYGKNSAFELNIPISITHKNKKYTSDLWLFGDITPSLNSWSLNYRGEFKTKETSEGFQFDDLVIDGKSVFNPATIDLASTLDLSVERKKVGTGNITAKADRFELNLKFSQFPMDFLNLIGEEIKNPYWPKDEGVAEGEVNFSRNYNLENATALSAKLHFPGPFTLGPDHQILGLWHLSFENEKWETSFITPKREVSFFRRAVLDFSRSQVSQYSQEIEFNGYDLEGSMLSIHPLSELWKEETQPYHSTFVSLKNCLYGDKVVSGSFRYGISPYEKFYQGELQQDQTKMNLKYLAKPTSQKFEAEFVKFSWMPFYNFLAPVFTASEGIVNGKVEGSWSNHWSEGTWLFKLAADQLKEPQGEFVAFNQNILNYFNLDASAYLKRSWNGSASGKTIRVNSFVLDGADPASISGNLSTLPKVKSYLTLTYPKNKKWKPVKKEVTEVFWKKDIP